MTLKLQSGMSNSQQPSSDDKPVPNSKPTLLSRLIANRDKWEGFKVFSRELKDNVVTRDKKLFLFIYLISSRSCLIKTVQAPNHSVTGSILSGCSANILLGRGEERYPEIKPEPTVWPANPQSGFNALLQLPFRVLYKYINKIY